MEYEHIAEVSSRLIANPVSYRMKSERIQDLVSRLKKCVK